MTTTTTTASSTKGLVAVLLDVTPAGWKGIGENKFLEAVKLATFFVNMHHGSTPTTLPDNSVIFHCYSQTSLIDIRPSDILSNGFSMHIDPQSVINELADFFESQATVEPEMTRSSSFSQCLSQVLCSKFKYANH